MNTMTIEQVKQLANSLNNLTEYDAYVILKRLAETNPHLYLQVLCKDSYIDAEIKRIFASTDSRIHAIKFYREQTGVGLREAKEYVEKVIGWVQKTY